MNKAKIMLLSVAVIAVVGGALAFKANSKFRNAYCLAAQHGQCYPFGINNATAVVGNNWYTSTYNTLQCGLAYCVIQGNLADD